MPESLWWREVYPRHRRCILPQRCRFYRLCQEHRPGSSFGRNNIRYRRWSLWRRPIHHRWNKGYTPLRRGVNWDGEPRWYGFRQGYNRYYSLYFGLHQNSVFGFGYLGNYRYFLHLPRNSNYRRWGFCRPRWRKMRCAILWGCLRKHHCKDVLAFEPTLIGLGNDQFHLTHNCRLLRESNS